MKHPCYRAGVLFFSLERGFPTQRYLPLRDERGREAVCSTETCPGEMTRNRDFS